MNWIGQEPKTKCQGKEHWMYLRQIVCQIKNNSSTLMGLIEQ